MRLYGATATAVGNVREVNEDRAWFGEPFAVLADGMGGHHGGAMAAKLAVEEFETVQADLLAQPPGHEISDIGMVELVQSANRSVHDHAADNGLPGMGTTLVTLTLQAGPRILIANVGDSRAYRLTAGGLVQITEDHSFVEDLVRQGRLTREEAAVHPQRNIVTRAIGIGYEVEVDLFAVEDLQIDDRFLLCSDGLFNEIPETAILSILRGADEPELAARALVAAALETPCRDNVTVVVVDVVADDDPRLEPLEQAALDPIDTFDPAVDTSSFDTSSFDPAVDASSEVLANLDGVDLGPAVDEQTPVPDDVRQAAQGQSARNPAGVGMQTAQRSGSTTPDSAPWLDDITIADPAAQAAAAAAVASSARPDVDPFGQQVRSASAVLAEPAEAERPPVLPADDGERFRTTAEFDLDRGSAKGKRRPLRTALASLLLLLCVAAGAVATFLFVAPAYVLKQVPGEPETYAVFRGLPLEALDLLDRQTDGSELSDDVDLTLVNEMVAAVCSDRFSSADELSGCVIEHTAGLAPATDADDPATDPDPDAADADGATSTTVANPSQSSQTPSSAASDE
jgi:serine/threonine protein phosphatase PrpC